MSPSEKSLSSKLNLFVRRLWRACEGMVAAEFAIIAPVMITIFFGVSELSDGLEAYAKVTSVASTASDLVAQEKVVCDTEMTDIFAALEAIMFPYPAGSNVSIRISSLVDGGNGLARVVWSDAHNTTARTVNSTISGLPAGLIDANGGSVIFSEVWYSYNNVTGQWLHGTIVMADKFYSHPRKVAQVTRTVNSC